MFAPSWVWMAAREFWTCGTPTWPAVFSTISSWRAMPAPWQVCATRRAPWLRRGTGPVRSAPC